MHSRQKKSDRGQKTQPNSPCRGGKRPQKAQTGMSGAEYGINAEEYRADRCAKSANFSCIVLYKKQSV